MTGIKRKGDHLSDEVKKNTINELIYFFDKERDEEIGVIAAEQLLKFFLETVGPELYNKGILDAKKALQDRIDELNYDLDDLLDE